MERVAGGYSSGSIQLSLKPVQKALFVIPQQRAFENLYRQRFFGSNPPSDDTRPMPPKPSIFFTPFVKAMAYWYTHPQWVYKVFPSFNKLIDHKWLPLFNPIEKVSFKSIDETPLQGYWLPATEGASNKTVIMGHGYTADFRELIAVAEPLRKKGYHCFLFDFRAHGASGGKKTSIGFHEGKDVAAAVKTVLGKFKSQAERLFYYGHSMGTASIMMTPKSLESHPDAFKMLTQHLEGIILDAPYFRFRESAEQFVKNMDQVERQNWLFSKLVAPVLKTWGLAKKLVDGFHALTPKYLNIPVDFFELKPAKLLADSPLGQRPVLVIHGTEDVTTPYHHGARVYEAIKEKNPTQTEMVGLAGIEHMNRNWKPVNNGRTYWTANRGNLTEHLLTFLEKIAGKPKSLK